MVDYSIAYGLVVVAVMLCAVMYFIGHANGYNKCLEDRRGRNRRNGRGGRDGVKFVDGNGRGFVDRRKKPRNGNWNRNRNGKRETRW